MAEHPLVATFASHPATEKLTAQLARIQKWIAERLSSLDANSANRLQRLHRLLAYVSAVVELADPVATGNAPLDELKQFLDNLEPHFASFESGNPGSLKAA